MSRAKKSSDCRPKSDRIWNVAAISAVDSRKLGITKSRAICAALARFSRA